MRAPAVGAKFERILQDGHHAEPEEIDLHDAEVFAVVLVPLADTAAGHGGRFKRHDFVEFVARDDHATGVLPKVARQAAHQGMETDHGLGAWMLRRNTTHLELLLQIERVRKISVGVEARETIQRVVAEAEDFADFACRAAAAIGDDVGGHRRAALAVTPVDLLNDALAAFAAREIEIDVGPRRVAVGADATVAEKALEEEAVLERVDGGDAEHVADSAVGGAAAALDENVLLPRPCANIPDDQEIAGEFQARDELELLVELLE